MINYVKFANFSFLTLFFSMIFYWVQVNFPILKRQSIGLILMALSNVLLLIFLILRWTESGHFPLSNIYEALMFLSWCFTVIHLILEKFTKNLLLSCISAPTAFFINAFATLSLPQELQKASPLVPALQSNWLMMHVTVMILSYAALISGSLLAIAFLILSTAQKNTSLAPVTAKYSQETNLQFDNVSKNQNLNLSTTLDNLSYRIIGVGFPLLTIGILSGAVCSSGGAVKPALVIRFWIP
jgi:cytochrome c-type biogenesis protein CcsB